MLVAALVFVVVLTGVFGAYWAFVLRLEEQDERAVRRRLKKTRAANALSITVAKIPDALSALGPLDVLLSRWQKFIEPLQRLRERSGLKVTVGAIVLACVFLATVGFVIAATLSGSIFAGVGGGALTTALQLVADETPAPVGTEFKLLFERQNYGMSLADALRAFGERVPIVDARFFVTALLTQREMGGNLSEVLENLASVIRERFRVKRQVRVVSAHGRITGFVLGCLPPAVGLVLLVLAPEHIRLLVDDPIGRAMLVTGVALQCIGIVVIRRIVQVEY